MESFGGRAKTSLAVTAAHAIHTDHGKTGSTDRYRSNWRITVNTKTEETRHTMYQHLEGVKKTIKKGFSPRAKMSDFESALEDHLEALRQEQIFSRGQLMNCRQANTDLQLRIHALEHAAHVNGKANIAAGDQLREAQALIQRQRGAIADMHMASRIKYWLCCGSTDPQHDKTKKSCHEAEQDHQERCRFGTAEQHSEWQKVAK